MENTIIAIGYIGIRKCYLNISEKEAIERYCKSEDIGPEHIIKDKNKYISTVTFKDEFQCYDVWEK